MIDSAVHLLPIGVMLGLAPFALMMMTPYLRISVVLALVRNALGVQQVPPSMVLNGLAIVMTLFVMAPVAEQTYALIQKEISEFTPEGKPYDLKEMLGTIENASGPWLGFLRKNTDPRVNQSLLIMTRKIWPAEAASKLEINSFIVLIPSFTISEMTKAFQIGFLLFLPFLVVDLVVSNILLALGMMMVSPITISLPLKLLLFVIIDGWFKISQGLMLGFN